MTIGTILVNSSEITWDIMG